MQNPTFAQVKYKQLESNAISTINAAHQTQAVYMVMISLKANCYCKIAAFIALRIYCL